MKTLLRIGAALVLAACIAGCATESGVTPSAVVTSPRKKSVETDRVKAAVIIGKSTKADVAAALGETLVISFDTGYEIWVYGLANARGAELVILFGPSGVVAKTRYRAA